MKSTREPRAVFQAGRERDFATVLLDNVIEEHQQLPPFALVEFVRETRTWPVQCANDYAWRLESNIEEIHQQSLDAGPPALFAKRRPDAVHDREIEARKQLAPFSPILTPE